MLTRSPAVRTSTSAAEAAPILGGLEGGLLLEPKLDLMRELGFTKSDFRIRVSDRNAWVGFATGKGLDEAGVTYDAMEAGSVDALLAAVAEVDAQGLEARSAPALAAQTASGETVAFGVVGQDRPGIVAQVTGVLSSLHDNIETFEKRLSVEPHSGAPLFHMDARLRLPPGLEAGAVQAGLEAISGEIMVDITLAPAG